MMLKQTNHTHYLIAANTVIALITMILMSFSAQLQSAESSDTTQCLSIKDNVERLACFDRLYSSDANSQVAPAESGDKSPAPLDDIDKRAQALMTKSKNSSDPFAANMPRISQNTNKPPVSQEESFGADTLNGEVVQNLNKIQASVASVTSDQRGYATFTLSNGQVWRQTEVSRFVVKENEIISIEKGLFGSYSLSTPDSNRRLRVKRIK